MPLRNLLKVVKNLQTNINGTNYVRYTENIDDDRPILLLATRATISTYRNLHFFSLFTIFKDYQTQNVFQSSTSLYAVVILHVHLFLVFEQFLRFYRI